MLSVEKGVGKLFAAYGGVHVSRANIVCHIFGIPMIYGSLIGLLRLAPGLTLGGARIDPGMVMLIGLVYFWARLEWRLALLGALAAPALWVIAAVVPLYPLIGVFVAGNAIPLAGHLVFEKGGPKSLNEGLVGTLIAPIWVLNLAVRIVPVR